MGVSVAYCNRLVARAGRRPDLVAALRPLVDAAAAEPGTLMFVVLESESEPDVVWCYELFADTAAVAAHQAGPETIRAGTVLAEVLAEPPAIDRARPVAAYGVDRS